MNNFLEFIKNDIEAKKNVLQSMPTNNKTNVKKYNNKIASINDKYLYYKDSVLKYINAKSESFEIASSKKDNDKKKEQLNEYKRMLKILNPNNTYVEKMGFDSLLYDIHNYSSFTFEEINNIISKLVDLFKEAHIKLSYEDFTYTCYVNEYMTEFLKNSSDTKNLSSVFEKIYWNNPNIIEHIELNFRKLIIKYQKSLECYINVEKKKILSKNKFSDYDEFIKEFRKIYLELAGNNSEDICDIIEMAKTNEIDINNYLPDSKFRITMYSTLTINEIDYGDEASIKKLLEVLSRLRTNLVEYSNYLKFKPLFNNFKNKFEKTSTVESVTQELKKIDSQINNKESKLDALNKKIFGKGFSLFNKKVTPTKNMKIEQVNLANELYSLYYKKDEIEMNLKIVKMKKDSSLFVSDIVKLFYSYDSLKRVEIAAAFNLNDYSEIINMCNEFDEFALNPTNVIINGIDVFKNVDVNNIIYNKYRMENINLEEADLDEDNISVLINKIDFINRIYIIENSESSIEKIWFIVQNEKINAKEAKPE